MAGAAIFKTLAEIWYRPVAFDVVKIESNISISDTSLKYDSAFVGHSSHNMWIEC